MQTRFRAFTVLAIAFLVSIASAKISGGQQPINMRQLLDGTMRPDAEVDAFEHSERFYPTAPVRRTGPVLPLQKSTHALGQVNFISGAKKYDLFDYLAVNRIAGLLVLKDSKVAFEDYELGAGPQTRWASFSMAKSVSSTLVAIALQQGLIRSLDDPVIRYLPPNSRTAPTMM